MYAGRQLTLAKYMQVVKNVSPQAQCDYGRRVERSVVSTREGLWVPGGGRKERLADSYLGYPTSSVTDDSALESLAAYRR